MLAKTMIVNGCISNSAMLFGNTIQLAKNSQLKADTWLIGENLIAEGQVHGNLTMTGNKVTLSGIFAQNVSITAQDIIVLPDTEIRGNLIYRCPSELVLDSKVILNGDLTRKAIPQKQLTYMGTDIFLQLILFFGALLVGTIFMALFPEFTRQSAFKVRKSMWTCLFAGFITFFLLPMIAFFAILSIVGIPFAVILTLMFIILIYMSKIIVAIMVGSLIFQHTERQSFKILFFSLLTGLILVYIGVGAGIVGLAIWFFVTIAGLGALLLTLFSKKEVTEYGSMGVTK